MQEKETFGTGTAFMMIAVAVLIDGVQWLLDAMFIGFIVNPFIQIVATIGYGIWFSHHNMSMINTRTTVPFVLAFLGELTPLGMLPLWTGFITIAVTTRKLKDIF